jgi:thioredoxin-dependent peroxiredoxin
MWPADTSGDAKARTTADNQTVRNVFVIGPDRKVKLVLMHPMTTGSANDEAKEIFGEWKSPKSYIRIVPQPR